MKRRPRDRTGTSPRDRTGRGRRDIADCRVHSPQARRPRANSSRDRKDRVSRSSSEAFARAACVVERGSRKGGVSNASTNRPTCKLNVSLRSLTRLSCELDRSFRLIGRSFRDLTRGTRYLTRPSCQRKHSFSKMSGWFCRLTRRFSPKTAFSYRMDGSCRNPMWGRRALARGKVIHPPSVMLRRGA